MKLMGIGTAAVLALAIAPLAAQQPRTGHPHHEDQRVTLTGCVVKADDGYLLTNVAPPPDAARPVGTTGAADSAPAFTGRIFYWLEEDDDLEGHAGHRIEVIGEIEDIDDGTVSIEREEGMIELEFKVEGDKKVTVKLPDTPEAAARTPAGTRGAVTDRERDHEVKVKKVDVKSVRMISERC